jgi:hypothetical protein
MPFLCRLNRHRRSASLAWVDGGFVRSACKHCGTQLVRTQPKTWVPVDGRFSLLLTA